MKTTAALSESKRMEKLLSLQPLDDFKPTQLPHKIEILASKGVAHDTFIRKLFLKCLTINVQLLLQSDGILSLSLSLIHLAELSMISVLPTKIHYFSHTSFQSQVATVDAAAGIEFDIMSKTKQTPTPAKSANHPRQAPGGPGYNHLFFIKVCFFGHDFFFFFD